MSASVSPARPADEVRPAGARPIIGLVVAAIVALDQWTKHLAVTHLVPRHVPHDIIGTVVRFTLTFNPGAAFGMHLGDASRWVFTILTLLILGFLFRLYRATPYSDLPLKFAVAVVMGGAVGNLLDRLRSPEGVVDFIDIGIGDTRFWTFNVADTAVSLGAIALVLLLWRRDLHAERAAAAGGRTEPLPGAESPQS